jgi:hypothetical protein
MTINACVISACVALMNESLPQGCKLGHHCCCITLYGSRRNKAQSWQLQEICVIIACMACRDDVIAARWHSIAAASRCKQQQQQQQRQRKKLQS